jgi:hypothetical protein
MAENVHKKYFAFPETAEEFFCINFFHRMASSVDG